MTVKEFVALCSRAQFRGLFNKVTVQAEKAYWTDGIHVTYVLPTLLVENDQPEMLRSSQVYTIEAIQAMSEQDARMTLLNHLKGMASHECEESLHIDGKQVVDPHPELQFVIKYIEVGEIKLRG